jgi:hypothetical protein
MSKKLVDAYKSTLYALDELVKLFEEDVAHNKKTIEQFKKIKKNLEQFLPIIENY